jgi:hypothetical protein
MSKKSFCVFRFSFALILGLTLGLLPATNWAGINPPPPGPSQTDAQATPAQPKKPAGGQPSSPLSQISQDTPVKDTVMLVDEELKRLQAEIDLDDLEGLKLEDS